MAVLVCLAFAFAAALPSASGAATVGYSPDPISTWIIVRAAAGEVNDLTLNGELAPTLSLIHDQGARLTVFPGSETNCAAAGHRATCWSDASVSSSTFRFDVSLEDGNDSAMVLGPAFSSLDGGDGNDRLSGGDGPGWLTGGAGADELHGGGGFDHALSPETPDGVGVNISLDDVANDGVPGEHDNVHSDIESIAGSLYADVLIGNDQANSLHGYFGDDVDEAGGGDDYIYDGSGQDSVSAGPGDDRVDVVGGPRDVDVVDCGPGTDTVIAEFEDQLVDCENVTLN